MTKIEICHQGAPRVNVGGVRIVSKSKDSVLLSVDMHSKHCETAGWYSSDDGQPVIVIGRTAHSLNLNQSASVDTDVLFSEYKGWDIFLAEITKYTLRVCLVKGEP